MATVGELKQSLGSSEPPPGLGPALQALWWDAKDNWERAHGCAQAGADDTCAWVHAYLHRKEGDRANAGYWYRRANKPVCTTPLDDEWLAIATALVECG